MSDTSITTKVVREYFSALDCPASLCCWLLFKYGEHQQLVEKEFNPLSYNTYDSARDALAAYSYLSKAKFLNLERDKEVLAYEKFEIAERECQKTNDRLATAHGRDPELLQISRKIASILGNFCPEKFVDSSTWGPGATLNIRGDSATATNKFDGNVEVTPLCYNFIKSWFNVVYPMFPLKVHEVDFKKANKVITVPKNAKTDRVIAIEPSLNLWFQKGVGCMIRNRLRSSGIDLKDQSHNQRLARVGSKFNTLATVDFSAASDTISSRLVLELIPEPWLSVMMALRSPRGYVKNSLIEYEKFSSMGNGFTFELESLIFYCVGLACTAEDDHHLVSIYGDDLIIPSYAQDRCVDLFDFLGFKINTSKSYWVGYYRESCGKHYWNGCDITPLYLKETINNEAELYKVHNAIRRYSHNRFNGYGCDVRFCNVCTLLVRYSKKHFKRVLRVPDGIGDGGLICNFDEASPPRLRHGHQGYSVKILIDSPRERWSDSHGLLLNRLWCTMSGDRQYGNIDFLPRRTRRRSVKTCVSVWRDLGPWL